jgi:Flp pilus assembly protein TadG
MTHHLRNKRGASQRGTALIEFAIVLPILLAVTLAALDLGRAFLAKNILHQAAREGVRMRAVMTATYYQSGGGAAEVEARVRQVAGAGGLTPSVIRVSAAASAHQDSVSVTAPFNFTFPLIFRMVGVNLANPMPLTATCYMRQE